LRLAAGEREYLLTHWQFLALLRETLRTQRQVRLAVLYGSLARGDEDGGSDLDLLVSPAGEASFGTGALSARLMEITGRGVDIAFLGRVEESAPLLLDRILDEGRVLVDRDGQWRDFHERRRAIRARAQRAHRRQMTSVAEAIEELTQ